MAQHASEKTPSYFRNGSLLVPGIISILMLGACSGSDSSTVNTPEGDARSKTSEADVRSSDEYEPIWGADLATVGGDIELERFSGSGDEAFEVNELDGMERVNIYLFCDSNSGLRVLDDELEAVVTSECPAVPQRVQIFGAVMGNFQIETEVDNRWTVMLAKPKDGN